MRFVQQQLPLTEREPHRVYLATPHLINSAQVAAEALCGPQSCLCNITESRLQICRLVETRLSVTAMYQRVSYILR